MPAAPAAANALPAVSGCKLVHEGQRFFLATQHAVELRHGERELAFIAGANDGGVWRLGTAIVPAHADFCLQLEFALDNLSSTKLLVCATFIRFVTRTIPSRGLLILQAEELSSNFTSNAADAAHNAIKTPRTRHIRLGNA